MFYGNEFHNMLADAENVGCEAIIPQGPGKPTAAGRATTATVAIPLAGHPDVNDEGIPTFDSVADLAETAQNAKIEKIRAKGVHLGGDVLVKTTATGLKGKNVAKGLRDIVAKLNGNGNGNVPASIANRADATLPV